MRKFINKLEALFLDFDGVVIESADIKTDAFYDLYLPYGKEIAGFAKEYHLEHQGVSRYKKFRDIHQRFLNKICEEAEIEDLSRRFSQLVFEKILVAPFVNGVIDYLMKLKDQTIPTFLLSATPHEELLEICKERKLMNLFNGIYGAPEEKSIIGENLIKEYQFNRNHILFIGDSVSDYNAAMKIGTAFIGRVHEEKVNPFSPNVEIIPNFETLAFLV